MRFREPQRHDGNDIFCSYCWVKYMIRERLEDNNETMWHVDFSPLIDEMEREDTEERRWKNDNVEVM